MMIIITLQVPLKKIEITSDVQGVSEKLISQAIRLQNDIIIQMNSNLKSLCKNISKFIWIL